MEYIKERSDISMNKETLNDHIDFVQARIEEIEKQVINYDPDKKGYKELVDGYNKWIDRYHELLIERDQLEKDDIEMAKLELERERMKIDEEIERDKINLEEDKHRLDREKFAYEVEHQKGRELISDILEVAEITGKILVPIAGLTGVIYVANLAYMNDSKLELCNGRVMGCAKDVLKVLMMRV